VIVDLEPKGNELSAYVSGRVRPLERLTAELGLRYDAQSHTGDETLSPRINVALDLAPRTVLRGAWGLFYQSHDLRNLDVINGVTEFYPAQRAEHRILGLSHAFRNGTSIRVEAYERRISHPWPEYRDLQPEMTDVVQEEFPEHIVRVDPTRALARGIELLVKRDVGGPFAWAATYALAEAEDEIEGEWIPRPRDQRHAVHIEFAYRPTSSWSLSCGWHYHSAWPGTQLDFDVRTLANGEPYYRGRFGSINALRLPDYHRLDLRLSRHMQLGRGRLSLFVDIFNLYGRPNVETYEYFVSVQPDRINVFSEYEEKIGVLPNIGARWEF
jgi:outer membrane cobalamin receptor